MYFPSGPGFESQVPHFLNVICFQIIQCVFKPKIYHRRSPINVPDGQMARSGGQALRAHDGLSQRSSTGSQKSKRISKWANKNCFLHPQKQAQTLFPSHFYLFNLIVLFCLINFLTNKQIFFLSKISKNTFSSN